MKGPRVRIAPSPTGDPHVGTAYVALFNRTFARKSGGSFLLRIDDTDRTRYRADSEQAIFRALRWLGIEWNEGPDIGGPCAPYRQSERTQLYRQAVERLLANGQAYRCFCTPERLQGLREQQRESRDEFGYDRHCRKLSPEAVALEVERGVPFTVRLRVPESGCTTFRDELRGVISVENREIDDQVLMKSDGFPTYHLASVVDDTSMGVTHIVRAEEWIISTPKHVLIYEALGEPRPLFFHVPLLRNADHTKISKRKNPVSLDWYREQGYLPEALVNFLSLLGWSPPDGQEIFTPDHFQQQFRLEDINTGGPVFDLAKLQWMNGVYLRKLPIAELAARLESEGFLPAGVDAAAAQRVLPVVIERLHLLSDFTAQAGFFFQDVAVEPAGLVPKQKTRADGLSLLASAETALAGLDPWNDTGVATALERVGVELGLKKPQLYMPLRMAVTGKHDSPPVPEVVALLGPALAIARVRKAHALLSAWNEAT
ncbi:MAG: glutamate--tRNA ligase [Planctomycetota bacterium]